jgi:hypothetical protein
VSSPGCASKAITVGAVDSANSVAYFSGRGLSLDIVAPGVSIYSSYKNAGYAYMSGTSMATPHLAGAVALLLEANRNLTTAQIKNALYTTTNPVSKCYNINKVLVTCTASMTGAGVVDVYKAYLKVKQIVPQCTVDANCSDGLYCNGIETCVSGTCVKGTSVSCSNLSDQCNTGVCNENTDSCVKQPKANGTACSDGLYCNTGENCQQGTCTGGSPMVCNDGNNCTTDTCNENTDSCGYVWPACGVSDSCCSPACNNTVGSQNYDIDCPITTQCWSSSYGYLTVNSSQAKKFCKCAMGTYAYTTYTYSSAKKTVYSYTDSSNNTVWTVSSRVYYPMLKVKCSDGKYYPTNQTYFR